jgi:CRISPR/Cas system-associated exonuclease Cas4 (RecB family)
MQWNGQKIHQTVDHNYQQKIKTKEDLPTNELVEFYDFIFEKERDNILFEDHSPSDLKDHSITGLNTYFNNFSYKVQPINSEYKIITPVNDKWDFMGFIDLIDNKYTIHDLKTSGKKQSIADHCLQLSAYAWACHQEKIKITSFQMDNLVIKSKPELVIETSTPASDLFENVVYDVIDAIEKEVFPRNPEGWHCSEKWCGYYGFCKPFKKKQTYLV